jgi:hypothetical protein
MSMMTVPVGEADELDLLRTLMGLRSLAISLLRLDGQTNVAAANRHHARDPQRTLQLLQAA